MSLAVDPLRMTPHRVVATDIAHAIPLRVHARWLRVALALVLAAVAVKTMM